MNRHCIPATRMHGKCTIKRGEQAQTGAWAGAWAGACASAPHQLGPMVQPVPTIPRHAAICCPGASAGLGSGAPGPVGPLRPATMDEGEWWGGGRHLQREGAPPAPPRHVPASVGSGRNGGRGRIWRGGEQPGGLTCHVNWVICCLVIPRFREPLCTRNSARCTLQES